MPVIPTAIVLASAAGGAYLAARLHALTWDGAIAAFVVGACAFGFLGIAGAATLFAFFIPAALLSRYGRSRKRALVDVPKTGARTATQVLANGGVAALCAVFAFRSPLLVAAFVGAFAAAAADTWATEIGTLARGAPRSIISGRRLATGLSGGVTLPGTLAEICGACVVGIVASAFGLIPWWIAATAGLVGATADSVLGATMQTLRYCPVCSRNCETNPHACGTPTRAVRGWPWFGNDAVNLSATAIGAASALAAVLLL